MADKVFISYGNQPPVAIEKVRTFHRKVNNIEFVMDSGVIYWNFSSATDTEFVMATLNHRYVTKLDTRINKEAKDAAKKIDVYMEDKPS